MDRRMRDASMRWRLRRGAAAFGLAALTIGVLPGPPPAPAHDTHAAHDEGGGQAARPAPGPPDAPAGSGTAPAAAARRAALATPGQLEREALALEILSTDAIARATHTLEQLLLSDPLGQTASGRATARRAAASTAAAAVYAVVNADPTRPVVFWGTNAPHEWHGLKLPRAGYGIENPDNVYRSLSVDGASRYVIRGRFPAEGPAELHFVVMDMRPRDGKIAAEGGELLASLRSDAMQIARSGRFTLEIDSAPANGRRNHLRIPATGTFPVHVRDLFTDWSRQKPVALEVERVAGPPASPREPVETLAARAAERLVQMGRFWVDFNAQYLYSRPANVFEPPRVRPGGRGVSAMGHFSLASDEALVVTVETLGARSLGIQLADPWGVAYEYVDRTSSLNQDQAHPNADGSYTWVISAADPGVHNWLDPDGREAGIMLLRWQVLPGEPSPAQAIREVRVVKRAALAAALPAGTRLVTRDERTAQRAERARQYQRRLEP